MKIKFAAVALMLSAAFCCSDSHANELLGRMIDRGGQEPVASTCCDTPAQECCGGKRFGISLNIGLHCHGNLFNRGCGGGCGNDCGNDCGGGGCGLFNGGGCGLFNRGGCGGGCDTGCAQPVNDCGSDCCGGGGILAGRGCGCGLFSGMFAGNGCCDNNYVDNCCGSTGGRCRLFSRGCGCGGNSCDTGCEDPCNSGGCGLLSHLRGRFGGCGGGCDTGCDTGCDSGCGMGGGCGLFRGCGLHHRGGCCSDPCDPCARPGLRGRMAGLRARFGNDCCDSGCGNSGCGCSGDAAMPMSTEPTVEPTPAVEGETTSISPIVDPNAFIIRGGRKYARN